MNAQPRPLWIRLLAPSRGKVIFGVIAGLLGYGLYWWYDGGRYDYFPRNWGEVEPNLIYRSGQIRKHLIEERLRDYEIQVIVDLDVDDAHDENEQAELAVAKRLGVRKVSLVGVDGSGVGDVEVYVEALTEMIKAKRSGTRMLVHCVGGSQRTGAATAWYRMLAQGWSGTRAHAEYMSYRRSGDGGRLTRWVNENMAHVVKRLIETGALDKAPDPLPVFAPGD